MDSDEEEDLPVQGLDPTKFSADDPAMLEYLEKHGYAVIKGAADAQAIKRAHDDFWDFHEGLGDEDGQCEQVLRSDPSTWGRDFLPHAATGIITGCGFGQVGGQCEQDPLPKIHCPRVSLLLEPACLQQSRFCWNLRTLPAVRAAFEQIWDTSDLVTSYDGGNAFRPWEARPEWRTQGGWWHCDQNGLRPGRRGRVCVQGLVTLTPAHEWTGGFCVMPGARARVNGGG